MDFKDIAVFCEFWGLQKLAIILEKKCLKIGVKKKCFFNKKGSLKLLFFSK